MSAAPAHPRAARARYVGKLLLVVLVTLIVWPLLAAGLFAGMLGERR